MPSQDTKRLLKKRSSENIGRPARPRPNEPAYFRTMPHQSLAWSLFRIVAARIMILLMAPVLVEGSEYEPANYQARRDGVGDARTRNVPRRCFRTPAFADHSGRASKVASRPLRKFSKNST